MADKGSAEVLDPRGGLFGSVDPREKRTLLQWAIGGLWWAWWMFGAILCCFAALLSAPFLLLGGRRLASAGFDAIADYYWKWLTYWFENWGGLTLVFSGDDVPERESALIVCNHRAYTDWLTIFCLASRKGRLGVCKFFAKDMVKYIPGIGWGLILLDSIFLKRDWNRDEAAIKRTFLGIQKRHLPVYIISFLEGTRYSPGKAKKSQEYAISKGLPVLKHHLFPRTKGFNATVLALRDDPITAVYDVTIGYPDGLAPTLMQIAMGWNKYTIKIHVKRTLMSQLPTTDQKLSDWFFDCFKQKDELMDKFLATGSFSSKETVLPFYHLSLYDSNNQKKSL